MGVAEHIVLEKIHQMTASSSLMEMFKRAGTQRIRPKSLISPGGHMAIGLFFVSGHEDAEPLFLASSCLIRRRGGIK
jgi:hypothetical protein